jgi:hypothetical protein
MGEDLNLRISESHSLFERRSSGILPYIPILQHFGHVRWGEITRHALRQSVAWVRPLAAKQIVSVLRRLKEST